MYTLLLLDDVPVDPRTYGPVVAPMLGLTVAEARMAIRKGRVLFLEKLLQKDAERLVEMLAADGIPARAVPSEQIPTPPPLRKAMQLDHGADMLEILPSGGETPEYLPWEAVGTVSVGAVARPEFQELFTQVAFGHVPPLHRMEGVERDLIRENLLLKMSKPSASAGKKPRADALFEEIDRRWGGKIRVYCDLLTQDLGTWLRIPMDEIAYRFLPGSIRMGGPWGFQHLVNDLRERAPGAFTGMALKLLDVADIKALVFPQVEEFTRYTAGCALTRVLWPTADSSSPSPEPPAPPTDGGSSSASSGPEPSSTS